MTIAGRTYRELINEVLEFQFAPGKYESLTKKWLNDAQQQLVLESEIRVQESEVAYTTLTTDPTLELPEDFSRLIDLFNTETHELMIPLDPREFDTLVESVGRPTHYTVIDNEVNVYPTPSGTYKLGLRYWRLPKDMVADSDQPEIPKQYHSILISYAMWKAYLRENDYQAAQVWAADWASSLLKMRGQVQSDVFDGPRQVGGSWGDPHGVQQLNVWR